MWQEFRDNSTRIFETIEKLCPTIIPYHNYPEPIRYLNFISKDKTNKEVLNAKRDYEIAKIESRQTEVDYKLGKVSKEELELKEEKVIKKEKCYFRKFRRDYRYYPSLRTLLLYLFNERHAKIRDINTIRKVLSNPRIVEIAPFLEYWKDFEKYGFDVFDVFSDILMEISHELRSQLHIKIENDTYLLRRVTERIFSEIEIHLQISLLFKKNEGIEKYNKLVQTRNKYRKNIASLKRMWIDKELKEIMFYEMEQKEFDFKQEIHNVIRNAIENNNSVINIEEVAQIYEIPTYNVFEISDESCYYEYKGKRYLITNACLILYSKVEDLKSLLIEGKKSKTITRYSQASSLLASNGIPNDCHSELIKRLGFKFIRENERGEYDSTDPLIVQKGVYAFKDFFDSIEYYPLVRQNFD